jgi:hypothetical protein
MCQHFERGRTVAGIAAACTEIDLAQLLLLTSTASVAFRDEIGAEAEGATHRTAMHAGDRQRQA